MKFVSLVIAAVMLSFSADAQSAPDAAEKRTVGNTQQKPKSQKAKFRKAKSTAAKNVDVVTLTDERAYKAKWTFEEMLKRRLEIDAEDGKKQQRKE